LATIFHVCVPALMFGVMVHWLAVTVATGVSVGAPPDDFFRAGQDWGFPPLHPLRVREDGYRYVRACLRHVLRHAGVVRIDHIIGLHRRYLVPQGMTADRGLQSFGRKGMTLSSVWAT